MESCPSLTFRKLKRSWMTLNDLQITSCLYLKGYFRSPEDVKRDRGRGGGFFKFNIVREIILTIYDDKLKEATKERSDV